jgi:CNT family concentrative nucleoside transporter
MMKKPKTTFSRFMVWQADAAPGWDRADYPPRTDPLSRPVRASMPAVPGRDACRARADLSGRAMTVIHGAFGVSAMLAIAWLMSERRGAIVWRPVWAGILLALALAAAMRWLPGMAAVLAALNGVLDALQAATTAGTAFVFGHLGGGRLPYAPTDPGASFVLATQALPLVLVMSALSAVLFHWGVLTRLVQAFAWVLGRSLGVGGAVGMS